MFKIIQMILNGNIVSEKNIENTLYFSKIEYNEEILEKFNCVDIEE